MKVGVILVLFYAASVCIAGHVNGREAKCEFSNEHNPMLGKISLKTCHQG
jgi:hypothetical protein